MNHRGSDLQPALLLQTGTFFLPLVETGGKQPQYITSFAVWGENVWVKHLQKAFEPVWEWQDSLSLKKSSEDGKLVGQIS